MVRLEGVDYLAVIDYAHTPDALEKILLTMREVKGARDKIITVVGCGGDRDKAKRPIMAKVAADLSDLVILTSDNPRSEDPDSIITDMRKGLEQGQYENIKTLVNRKEAIQAACATAQSGDIVLIAGKGHEKYQEIKGKKFPFDDKKIVKDYMST